VARSCNHSTGMETVRAYVHERPELAQRLAGLSDEALLETVIALARTLGVELTPDDVAAASAESRRDWLQRWIR
jgi:hypothetical protein